jgi:Rrf2 family protein
VYRAGVARRVQRTHVDNAESRTLYSTQWKRAVHTKPSLTPQSSDLAAAPRRDVRRRDSRRDHPRRSSIMNVGRRVDYAIRALCYLAAQGPQRVVPRAEIQARQNIPPHFLSKILRSLVGAGFLESVSGARGGFRLGRPAHDISVRAVYESVEGRLSLIDCVDRREGFCCFAPVCTQIDIWSGAQQMLGAYLDNISIGDIADRNGLVSRLREQSRHA